MWRGFFFALLALTRFVLDVGFLHRPLVAALLWSTLTFELQPAMSVGIFFELLWLDLFPAGTFIPPHALLALTASLTILNCLPEPDMRTTALVLISTLPLAYAGAWVEQRYRKRQNLSYNSLIVWNRRRIIHAYNPTRLVYVAVGEQIAGSFVVFVLSTLALLLGLRLFLPLFPHGAQPGWPMLWIAASLGAILALRLRKAYALAFVSLVIGIVLSI